MKTICLIGFMSLMVLVSARATPQASDQDLKIAQVPPITLGQSPNYRGLRAFLAGDLSGAGLNLSGQNIESLNALGVSNMGPNTYIFDGVPITDGLGNLATSGQASTLSFVGCGLTNFDVIVYAFTVSTLGNQNYILSGNAVTTIGQPISCQSFPSGGTSYLGLNSNRITSIAGLGYLAGATVDLSSNAFTSFDLTINGGTGGAVDLGDSTSGSGQLLLNNNPALTTITAGDGVSTGITSMLGGKLNLAGCALDTGDEDSLLAALVGLETNLPGNNATLDISGGTNAVPDGTGAGYIATLVGTGWTVTTN